MARSAVNAVELPVGLLEFARWAVNAVPDSKHLLMEAAAGTILAMGTTYCVGELARRARVTRLASNGTREAADWARGASARLAIMTCATLRVARLLTAAR